MSAGLVPQHSVYLAQFNRSPQITSTEGGVTGEFQETLTSHWRGQCYWPEGRGSPLQKEHGVPKRDPTPLTLLHAPFRSIFNFDVVVVVCLTPLNTVVIVSFVVLSGGTNVVVTIIRRRVRAISWSHDRSEPISVLEHCLALRSYGAS